MQGAAGTQTQGLPVLALPSELQLHYCPYFKDEKGSLRLRDTFFWSNCHFGAIVLFHASLLGTLRLLLGVPKDKKLGLGRYLKGRSLGQFSIGLIPLEDIVAAPLGPSATSGSDWEKPQLSRKLYWSYRK